MRQRKIRGVICRGLAKGVRLRRCITASASLLLLHFLAIPCIASELKQKTVEVFDHYVHDTEARMDAELRPSGPFLWVDSLPQPRRQRLYDLLQRGQLEIRQEKTEEEGKPIEAPDGLIHHWTGVAFVPGVSLERALSLLQDYDNHWRTYKPDVRRSKLLEHTDDTFKIYLQFYRDSPRRVSFNTEFQVHYTRIDGTHMISHAVSARIAELEHPEQPDSPEFPVGQGNGYLWRVNNYWRRVSRQTLANLLYATRRELLNNPDKPPLPVQKRGSGKSRRMGESVSLEQGAPLARVSINGLPPGCGGGTPVRRARLTVWQGRSNMEL